MSPTAHFDLRPHNTFGLSAHADWGASFHCLTELKALLADPRWARLPRLVIGGGSNLLFTGDFHGLALVNCLRGIEVREEGDVWCLDVAAGENWHDLVAWTLAHQMPGLENLALIPGTVGAAPVQNIGAYGVELARFCLYVDAFNPHSAQVERFDAQACRFGYRDSCFKHKALASHIITRVGLRLPKLWQSVREYGPLRALPEPVTPEAIFACVCETRRAKLPEPEQLGNAGSFFKNPSVPAPQAEALLARYPNMPHFLAPAGQIKLAAGWLIDQAGLKGAREGQAAVHTQQALVLVNLGGATARQVQALARRVQETVQAKFGVALEPEVRFIGSRGELESRVHEASE